MPSIHESRHRLSLCGAGIRFRWLPALLAAAAPSLHLPAQPAEDFRLVRGIAPDAGSTNAPLLVGFGVHIEPLGATVSALAGGAEKDAPPPKGPYAGRKGFGPRQGPGYRELLLFERHLADLRAVAAIVERRGGRMTVQAQTPFTEMLASRGDRLFAELQDQGHEIGLHFHEDAHLGRSGGSLPVATWAAVMKEEIDKLRAAGARDVRGWSGGNLYPGVLEAAAAAGLRTMYDYKNPRVQRSDLRLIGIHPWRPAGGPAEGNLDAFARHDPKGAIVYLPEGRFDRTDFNSMRRSNSAGGDWKYFDFLTAALEDSLRAARPGRVNVFHITVHAGEFRGPPVRPPFEVIDAWLASAVAPVVKDGRARWATFSQMAEAFAAWERAHPGEDPRPPGTAAPAAALPQTAPKVPAPGPGGCITFVVNVHDWRRPEASARTVLRLIDIFERHKVRGDFYLTAPVVEAWQQKQPEVVRRLKDSAMTIGYHFRPPHPGYGGFDARLRGLDDAALAAALRDVETHRLDLATGATDPSRPGGYAFVAETFGRKPVAASALTRDPRIKTALLDIYRDLGARMTMEYHEAGTKPDQPFEYRQGLLIRPSDFSVTRWAAPGEREESFWWNRIAGPGGDAFRPAAQLERRLAAWNGPRPPLVTALIHENDFYVKGQPGWAAIYFDGEGRQARPRRPPFDLDAPDTVPPRSPEEQEAIWKAYEAMVAAAAERLRVVTSEDLVAMAEAAKTP